MRVCLLFLFFCPLIASAQVDRNLVGNNERESLHYNFTLYSQADGKLAPSFAPVKELVSKMEARKQSFKSDKAFLRFIYDKTHHKFLHKFNASASFRDLIVDGKYNCLGATSLFSLLLNHFGFEYRIVETNYHIFLVAHTSTGDVLLETTDPQNGFVDDPVLIRKRIDSYRTQAPEKSMVGKKYFQYNLAYEDTVSAVGLLGLLHYNHAINLYNEQNLKHAITHLHHAFLLHRSPKVERFLELMITTVRHSTNLDSNTRDQYLSRLQNLQRRKTLPATSAMIPLIR